MSKNEFYEKYRKSPTYVTAGESASAKSQTTAKLADAAFYEGMNYLSGDGMTTSCETEVVIDPHLTAAKIILERTSDDEIRANLLKNLQSALVSECRNVVASLPANNSDALVSFVAAAAEKRAKFQDEKFRVHKLLLNKKMDYHDLLTDIFTLVLKRASEPSFRSNCKEAGKESKSEITIVIEGLVSSMLDTEECKELLTKLLDLIHNEIDIILEGETFSKSEGETEWYELEELDPDRFAHAVKAISNSEKKELEGIASIACAVKSMKIAVPGKGLNLSTENGVAYRLIDIVGFTNDGFGRVNELVRNAVLTQYNYDGIIYFASKRSINKTHESLLTDILKTMRPAKLILISTFMDKDSIFDEDEEPTLSMIQELNRERSAELLTIVKKAATDDLHIILPGMEDIICISNKVNKRKHGEAALTVYGDSQYDQIRHALERAANVIRKKISVGVSPTAQYLVPENEIKVFAGQIVLQLGTAVDDEYSAIRDFSEKIHHWTLDAVLWHLVDGREHISDAKVWKNVRITTFSEMQKICRTNLGKFKFSPEVKVGRQEDSIRIKKEFMANLDTELFWLVRRLILNDAEDTKQNSVYKEKIRQLAFMSKYNKWMIVDELRLTLLKAVAQTDYLESMLEEAIQKALLITYEKILY